jgi:isopenicillin N synthase-like dioxygenase
VQFYNVGQDDMTGVSEPMSNPPCIEAHRSDIRAYMERAHSVVNLLCSHLDRQLQLVPGTLMSLQPMTAPSGTSLRMLRCLPQPTDDRRTSLLGHTDLGSLTILFNITGGLQLLAPDSPNAKDERNWRYVQPVPGCAIVNLGDAMVEWTAGILRSNMHRITFAPGEQGTVPRYSLAYLVRPDGDAPMKRLSGGESLIPEPEQGEADDSSMNARQWEAYRAVAIGQGRDNARSRGGRPLKVDGKSACPTAIAV